MRGVPKFTVNNTVLLSRAAKVVLLREGSQGVYRVPLSSGIASIETLGVHVISQRRCQSSLIVVKVPEGRSRLNTPGGSPERNNDPP